MAKTETPLRKITIGTVYGKVKLADLMEAAKNKGKNGGMLPILDVWGVATAFKVSDKNSAFGEYTRFRGQFRAINLETGEAFRSSALMLPRFLEEELSAGLDTKDAATPNVEFALRISAKFDESAATKYVYMADAMPGLEPKESDQLKALTDKVNAARKQLPAPKG